MKLIQVLAVATFLFAAGCAGIPPGVRAVENFDIERYQGTWYEIARLDHRFERGLTHVSATYTLRHDRGVAVHNRGYAPKNSRWKEVRGRAYFVEDPSKGRLKVTFFWPFYGAYNVIALDEDAYSFAMVCGPSKSYLWILGRNRTLPASILDNLIAEATQLGFPTDALIFVPQGGEPGTSPGASGALEMGDARRLRPQFAENPQPA